MKDQTKRILFNIGGGLISALMGLATGNLIWDRPCPGPDSIQDILIVEDRVDETEPTLDDHIARIVPTKLQNICKALVWVESRGHAEAYRKTGDCLGILQITPIYVKECNRLQSKVTYTLEDRADIVKSLEMFTIIQNYHNPNHDLERAIHLHNPTAGPDYRTEVLQRFETIY